MNIEVKRAFVLADWMKAAQRCESEREFDVLLASEGARVRSLSEPELDQIIGKDRHRLERFETFAWIVDEKCDLAKCWVYHRMGGRSWAVGTVQEVAEKFHRMEPLGSRVWRMKLFAMYFKSQLPLIVLNQQGVLRIDDGSHRAVAMWLAGVTQATAYIGTTKLRNKAGTDTD
jgi:hypothetical protein